jgi:hypothetical protein
MTERQEAGKWKKIEKRLQNFPYSQFFSDSPIWHNYLNAFYSVPICLRVCQVASGVVWAVKDKAYPRCLIVMAEERLLQVLEAQIQVGATFFFCNAKQCGGGGVQLVSFLL